VPVPGDSLVDLTVELDCDVTVESINAAMKVAAGAPAWRVMGNYIRATRQTKGGQNMFARSTRIALRSLRWFIALAAIYAAAGFLLLPWLAERQIAVLLQDRLGVQFKVDDISFNPFALQLTVERLDMIDADGWRVLSLERAFINLQADSLVQSAFSFREVHVDGLHFSMRRYNNVDNNLSRLAQRWSAGAAPAVPQSAVEGVPDSVLPRVLIADLSVQGASLGLTDNVPTVPYIALIDALDFQVENLSTLPESPAGQTLSLTMGNGSRVDWRGSLSLAPLRSQGEVQLRGPYPALVYEYLREQLPVRLAGGWLESQFNYTFALADDGGAQLAVDGLQLNLSDLDIHERHSGALLARMPEIALSGGSFDLGDRSAGVQSLRLGGFDLRPERFEDGGVNVLQLFPAANTADQGPVGQGAVPPVAAPWSLRLDELVLDSWQVGLTDRVPVQDVVVGLGIEARLSNLVNQPGVPFTVETVVNVSSGGTLRASGEVTVLPQLDASLELLVEALALPVVQPYIEGLANIALEEGRVGLEGNLLSGPGRLRYEGSVGVEALLIRDTLQGESLFRVGALDVSALALDMADETRLTIGDLRVSEPYARIEIAADGSTNLGSIMVAGPAADANSAVPRETVADALAEPLPALQIERIRIDNASADFSDRSLPLPFAVLMTRLNGEISAISTRSTEPARVRLEGQVGEFGLASIEGRLRPLAFNELTEIALQFRNLDIPTLSPYVIKFAGRRIDDGAMDVDLAYEIADNQLSGDNALRLRDLVLGDEVQHPDALDLPLGLAVALLKDRNGVIDLEVPVTGDLGNPQFSYGGIIRTALANIIRNVVTAPFRFLANLVGGAQDADIGVIAFLPGRTDLAPPERENLLTLARALTERPQLQLSLSGGYHQSEDTRMLQEQFLDRRVDAALAPEAEVEAADAAPVPTRRSVLEGFYRAADLRVAGEATVDEALAALQSGHSLPEADNAPAALDELAYTEALRRALLPVEPVAESDLVALANERIQTIAVELAVSDPALGTRLNAGDVQVVAEVEGGWIPLALALDAEAWHRSTPARPSRSVQAGPCLSVSGNGGRFGRATGADAVLALPFLP